MHTRPSVPQAARRCGPALAGLLTFLVAVPLHAVSVGSGIVLMTTSQLKPVVWQGAFLKNTFDLGSDPMLDARLVLRGAPLVTRAGTPSLGTADTVIALNEGATFPSNLPEPRTIRTQVMAIHLVSAEPLTVTYGGANPELWDYQVCLSRVPAEVWEPVEGRITLVDDCSSAGTFISVLIIRPRVIFTRRRDGRRVVLDQHAGVSVVGVISHGYWTWNSPSSPTGEFTEFLKVPSGAEVDQDCNGHFETTLPASANIILGLERIGCNWLAQNDGYPAVDPIRQSFYEFQVMTPTPRIGGPDLPFPLDNRTPTPICEPVGGQP